MKKTEKLLVAMAVITAAIIFLPEISMKCILLGVLSLIGVATEKEMKKEIY